MAALESIRHRTQAVMTHLSKQQTAMVMDAHGTLTTKTTAAHMMTMTLLPAFSVAVVLVKLHRRMSALTQPAQLQTVTETDVRGMLTTKATAAHMMMKTLLHQLFAVAAAVDPPGQVRALTQLAQLQTPTVIIVSGMVQTLVTAVVSMTMTLLLVLSAAVVVEACECFSFTNHASDCFSFTNHASDCLDCSVSPHQSD